MIPEYDHNNNLPRKIAECEIPVWHGPRRLLPLVGAFSVLLLAACGPSNEERLSRGEASFAEGEFRAAAIDARSVLQSEPQNIGGRILLGRSALRLGDLDAAEKELRRAIELGADKASVAADLGQVLAGHQKYQQVLDEITLDLGTNVQDATAIAHLRADASLALGKTSEARALYREILAANDRDAAAMLGVVSTYLAEEQFEQARATLDEARTIDNSYIPTWIKSAEMNFSMRNAQLAESDFAKAAELAVAQSAPELQAAALRGLVETRLVRHDVDGAQAALTTLTEIAANDIRTLFLQGRMAYVNREFDRARQQLQALLAAEPEFRPAQMLLGAVHLSTGNLGQAEMHLSAVVAATPENADARRLLAETRMRQNRADDATSLLRPLVDDTASDSQSLGMAARANLAAGNYAAATELLRRRMEQDPANTALQLDLAAALLAAGDVAGAEQILATGGDATEADAYRREMLGILSRVRSGDIGSATSLTQAMIERHPDDPRLYNMLGGIYLTAGDAIAAKTAFNAVLAIAPNDSMALSNLGRIEAELGNVAAARSHFLAVLNESPEDEGALMALGALAVSDGNRSEAIEWLEKARAASATGVAARLMLAQQYATQGDFDAAAKVATEAVELEPQSAAAHAALGAAREGLGDDRRALQSFRRAAELEPDNVRYSLHFARAQIEAGEQAEATRTIANIEDQVPRDLHSSVQLAALKANAGDIPGALRIGEDLLQRFPDSESPHLLLGELYFSNGEPVQGAEQFDRALDKSMSLRTAGRAYVLRKANAVAAPEQPIQRFLEQNPDHEMALLTLAQHYQGIDDEVAAIDTYNAVLTRYPQNFVALNNLAWLLFTTGDDRAESLARRAYQAAPENGSVADTLGWILVRNGAHQEGVELLRKADKLSGGLPTIRYHLAVGLVESGDTDAARSVLDDLLSGGRQFAERSEAEALLRGL